MGFIEKSTLTFLKKLAKNNDRDWFNEHKPTYEQERQKMILLADDILEGLKSTDEIETVSGKKSIFRIYRDVRFSKNKAPYKNHFSGSFKRLGAERRGGYYFHVEPGASMIGGGFWGPSSDDLKHLRNQIAQDADPLRKVIADKNFVSHFGELSGEKLKTAPKGFPKDHDEIDLLRHKTFVVRRNFTDNEVLSDDFPKEVLASFVAMRPFFDLMSDYLTTDLNGQSLL